MAAAVIAQFGENLENKALNAPINPFKIKDTIKNRSVRDPVSR